MQAWAGFAGVGAVLWVAHKSRSAFDDWLKQKQTERRLDVAEKALLIVYRAEDVIKNIRNPGSFGHEIERAKESLERSFANEGGVPERRRANLEIAQIALQRINDHGDFWSEYLALRPQIRAYFGTGYSSEYEKIWVARTKILVAAQAYGRADPAREERDQRGADERRDKWEATFWDGWADAIEKPDEVAELLKQAVERTEQIVQPLLDTASKP